MTTLLEGAGCVRNISNISKNSKIYYGVNKAVKLDDFDEYTFYVTSFMNDSFWQESLLGAFINDVP